MRKYSLGSNQGMCPLNYDVEHSPVCTVDILSVERETHSENT